MTFKILLFLGLVASALATPARVTNDQCPLRTLKDAASCRDQHSECWSPGEGDVDCPNNGLCCFDGCVNKCKIPGDEFEVVERPPKCRIEYEQKMELVKMDHCVDVEVPDCRMVTRTECKKVTFQRCEVVKKPIETHVPDEKCSTKYKEVCKNKVKQWCPNTREGRAGFGCQDMTYKECKKVPYEHCQHFTRTVITYVNENVCKPIEETKCYPVTEEKCTTKTEKQCKTIEKEMYFTVPVEKCEKLN